MLDEEADLCADNLQKKKAYLRGQAKDKRELSVTFNESVLGCTKDINFLTVKYEELEKALIKKYGKFDEEICEKEERKYWIMRLYRQAARNIRQSNHIDVGNQGALEDFGLDPTIVEAQIRDFIKSRVTYMQQQAKNNENCDVSSAHFDSWIHAIGDELSGVYAAKQTSKGFNPDIVIDHLTLREKNDT